MLVHEFVVANQPETFGETPGGRGGTIQEL